MSNRHRLAQHAEKVKKAGMAGKSMTEELSKVAAAEDLTADEISRIAEMANRDVQLGLMKTATDKRFKFDLADPASVKVAARKVASTVPVAEVASYDKVASAVDEAGGDPFAAPYRPQEDFSLFRHEPDPTVFGKVAADMQEFEDRTMLFELDKARLEQEALILEGEKFASAITGSAVSNEKLIIQAAMDMIHNGVTLPSLYEALAAAVSGSTVDPAETEAVDTITRMVIEGLKGRGVENYQMGFRDHGDPEAMAAMTTDQLLDRCKALSAYDNRDVNTFSMHDVKTAVYFENSVPDGSRTRDASVDPGITALELLHQRPSVMEHKVPQMYLDQANNTPNGQPRVINGNNEFVVAVKNLVGDQRRLRQVHGAQEYLGLKLKQLEEAIRKMMNVRQLEEQRLQKTHAVPQGVG